MSGLLCIAFMSCDRAGHVERSLGSVLAQTVDDLDVIVSDDCSTDGTFEELQAIVGRYRGGKRVRLRRNGRRLGVVGHFNAIMAEAQSDYVMFAHDDDVSEPLRAGRIIAALRAAAAKPGAVYHNALQLDAEGRSLGEAHLWPAGMAITPETVAAGGANIVGAVATWPRAIVEVFGPVPAKAHFEDGAALFRAALLGNVVFLPEPLVSKRLHPRSLTGPASVIDAESGKAARQGTLNNLRNLRFVPDVWLQDLAGFGDRLPGGAARREALAALIGETQRRVSAEIALLERRPWALAYWGRGAMLGRLPPRQFAKMLMLAYAPELWSRYVRWSLARRLRRGAAA